MENNYKSGFSRRSGEDRREYGDRRFSEEGQRTPRPKRPRIGRPSQGGEKLFSSSDERKFIPAGERSGYSGFGGRKNEYGERREGGRREYGSRTQGERRNYGTRNSDSRRTPQQKGFNSYGHDSYDRNSTGRNSYDRNSTSRNSYDRNSTGRNSYDRNSTSRRFQTGQKAGRPGPKPFAKNQPATAASGINKMIDRKRKQAEEAFSDYDYTPVPVKEEVRLNKFIANSGICSRREADNFIQAGVVTVNGEVVTELGTKININTDDVRFNGERLKGEKKVYIVMNKPKGYVTTTSDPHAEKTVMDLLKGCKSRVFSVGRLDKNTTGVLMFTNDGEMAEKLTHPSYNKKKIYQVTLSSDLSREDYEKILSGVTLTDGDIAADELEYIDESDHRKLGIEIHSGKNRIVRRIFESLGYEVKGLDRVYFAGLTKKGLKKGQWRFLTDGEVNILRMGSYQ